MYTKLMESLKNQFSEISVQIFINQERVENESIEFNPVGRKCRENA
jgi:hypothetical protein